MYLLDTNVLVDFLRGKNQYALRMLRASNAGVFRIPSVVKAELLLGVEKSADPGPNRLKAELLLLPFEVLPFDDKCALHYARIRAHLEGKGMPMTTWAPRAPGHMARRSSPTPWGSSTAFPGFRASNGPKCPSETASPDQIITNVGA